MVSYYDGVLIAIPIAFLSGIAVKPLLGLSGIALGGILAMLLIVHAMFIRSPVDNTSNKAPVDTLPDSENPSMTNTAD